MRYWDASALIPLIVDEGKSQQMEDVLREDDSVATWWGTRIECISAIRRKEREGQLEPQQAKQASLLLDALAEDWAEVQPALELRSMAGRLLAVHPLRTGDAFQLAAALRWSSEISDEAEVITLDERLKDAAMREGLLCS
ncbi:MAG: type II toxin-antitoxin system VapC family toxin [Solirubrobacterales bacterium]